STMPATHRRSSPQFTAGSTPSSPTTALTPQADSNAHDHDRVASDHPPADCRSLRLCDDPCALAGLAPIVSWPARRDRSFAAGRRASHGGIPRGRPKGLGYVEGHHTRRAEFMGHRRYRCCGRHGNDHVYADRHGGRHGVSARIRLCNAELARRFAGPSVYPSPDRSRIDTCGQPPQTGAGDMTRPFAAALLALLLADCAVTQVAGVMHPAISGDIDLRRADGTELHW